MLFSHTLNRTSLLATGVAFMLVCGLVQANTDSRCKAAQEIRDKRIDELITLKSEKDAIVKGGNPKLPILRQAGRRSTGVEYEEKAPVVSTDTTKTLYLEMRAYFEGMNALKGDIQSKVAEADNACVVSQILPAPSPVPTPKEEGSRGVTDGTSASLFTQVSDAAKTWGWLLACLLIITYMAWRESYAAKVPTAISGLRDYPDELLAQIKTDFAKKLSALLVDEETRTALIDPIKAPIIAKIEELIEIERNRDKSKAGDKNSDLSSEIPTEELVKPTNTEERQVLKAFRDGVQNILALDWSSWMRNDSEQWAQRLKELPWAALAPVILGKDGTPTNFTPYFIVVRPNATNNVGFLLALPQGIEGGHVSRYFNHGKELTEVRRTTKPAVVKLAVNGKWILRAAGEIGEVS